MQKYIITCLISRRDKKEYYSGSGWSGDRSEACLYASFLQAEKTLERVRDDEAAVLCVIQNKQFDFYDGETFVYNVRQAELYAFNEALARLEKLNGNGGP